MKTPAPDGDVDVGEAPALQDRMAAHEAEASNLKRRFEEFRRPFP